MNITLLKGYPDFVGKRAVWCGFGNGPASYVRGGDPVVLPNYEEYMDVANGAVQSVSGNYSIITAPAGTGPRQVWKAKWLYAGGQVGVDGVVVSGTNGGGTPGTYTVNGVGGGGSGASISVVIAVGGAITSVSILTSGAGYTSVPTFATPGSSTAVLTATIGVANGGEVSAATNLSAEQIQLGGFCGQY